MSLKNYIILMVLATLFCWGSFLIVVYSVDPFNTVGLGFLLFYISLFFSLIGTFSVLGFAIRYFIDKTMFVNQQVMISFRQAVWLSFLFVFSLFLQSMGLIAWWNLLILVALLVAVEYYFESQKPIISR